MSDFSPDTMFNRTPLEVVSTVLLVCFVLLFCFISESEVTLFLPLYLSLKKSDACLFQFNFLKITLNKR